jgi:predicted nucleic acid-binding protein
MAVLIDTNILLRLVQPHHPHCAAVERAVSVLRSRKETLNVVPQNLIEFWTVATRPEGSLNGAGMTIDVAMRELAILKRLFPMLPESSAVYERWERLVTTYRVSGKNTHDARLVAAMEVHGIGKILTINVQDFNRYKDIEVMHPDSLHPE